jgi:predicted dehydrogenase
MTVGIPKFLRSITEETRRGVKPMIHRHVYFGGNFTRREFLRRSTAGAAGLSLPLLIPRSVLGEGTVPGANGRIRVGVIGVGGRARQLIDQLPEQARIVALADCFLPRCAEAVKAKNASWPIHQDYRKLLDDKNIDAVIVATCDHTRVLPCIQACQAGKDIYAEKPLTLTVREGRTLVNAVRKHRRVLQVGTQQRTMEMNRFACEFVRSGGLGKLKKVKGINYSSSARYPGLPEEKIPAGLDWDAWLGQAELRPYNSKLQFGWMGWHDYSGGQMTNWGAHGIDQIQWALGMDGTGPVEFGPLPELPGAVYFRYANGVQVDLSIPEGHGPMGGAIFIGQRGKIEINRNKFTTNPKDLIENPPPESAADKWRDEVAMWQAKYHIENWLECMRTRKRPHADVEIGHRSISVCHLANITRELGRKLRWDPVKEQFVGDAEADKHLSRPRRKGYELPTA